MTYTVNDGSSNVAFTEFPTTYTVNDGPGNAAFTEFPTTYTVHDISNQMLLEEYDEGAVLFDSPIYSYGL